MNIILKTVSPILMVSGKTRESGSFNQNHSGSGLNGWDVSWSGSGGKCVYVSKTGVREMNLSYSGLIQTSSSANQ